MSESRAQPSEYSGAKDEPSLPLGRASDYPAAYDAELLFPIPRAENRIKLLASPAASLPFGGADLWNAYEISWLGAQGKPEIRAAQFRVPWDSPAIIESKSLKLYLNGLNQHRFESAEAARATIAADLTRTAGAPVEVRLFELREFESLGFQTNQQDTQKIPRCLDGLDVTIDRFRRDPGLLRLNERETTTPGESETSVDRETAESPNESSRASEATVAVYTNLFKSNCPVTGQPDWASVFIEYARPEIDEASLLAYLISYRNEEDFHEHCVEQIFVDINERCRPERLTVYACFLRRGGIDINPFRSNFQSAPEFLRSVRQ